MSMRRTLLPALLLAALLAGCITIVQQPEPTPSPTTVTEASPSVEPSPTDTLAPTASPTTSPTASPTQAPTAPPTPSPSPTATPTAPPTPTPTPTAAPTPIACANTAGYQVRSVTLDLGGERRLGANVGWCIKDVVFSDGSGDGVVKVFLDNEVFTQPPTSNSSSRYGWSETNIGFFAAGPYSSVAALPFGWDYVPPSTLVTFEVHDGCAEACAAKVTIRFVRGPAP